MVRGKKNDDVWSEYEVVRGTGKVKCRRCSLAFYQQSKRMLLHLLYKCSVFASTCADRHALLMKQQASSSAASAAEDGAAEDGAAEDEDDSDDVSIISPSSPGPVSSASSGRGFNSSASSYGSSSRIVPPRVSSSSPEQQLANAALSSRAQLWGFDSISPLDKGMSFLGYVWYIIQLLCFSLAKLDAALTDAIVNSGSAFSFVENPHWRKFLQLLRPAYSLPNRRYISVCKRTYTNKYSFDIDMLYLCYRRACSMSPFAARKVVS